MESDAALVVLAVAAEADARVIERLTADAEFVSSSVEDARIFSGGESLNAAYARLRIQLFQAERVAMLRARSEGRYQEAAVRTVMQIIDAEDTAARVTRQGEY